MDQIVILLGRPLDLPRIGKTGLAGYFNMKLQFNPETAPRMAAGATPASTSPPAELAANDPASPSSFAAVNEQLGLKLEFAERACESSGDRFSQRGHGGLIHNTLASPLGVS
jgi:uncharacterized protein (TIGR03435 family)